MSDDVGHAFAALADPTRRWMIESLLREETTTVPELTAAPPITRQAVAKHLATLDGAGLVERTPAVARKRWLDPCVSGRMHAFIRSVVKGSR